MKIIKFNEKDVFDKVLSKLENKNHLDQYFVDKNSIKYGKYIWLINIYLFRWCGWVNRSSR